ncbi:gamma-glutamyltransferase [Bordetella avium]|uniref:Glutathione hydrolase proenzyme n=1 Tax=Bordetella avium (strain 197N) TaxID=360910 RepID=Q2KVS0_BORA1|nr:gamma-glutamyltransferase [Bordetella avium]AZY50184.1 gamma-glutamyltransferase [Bordetella avium]AZY53578.1 gamma-glutamyltransferase [Bordetella avium]RIQ16341.1 gamma-glutamyltransferase [Bordetella avium]RIQ33981.1 gamma-glutamyltransferase [Bordetella avium]RIQ52168.1 gamma-glutamyltransferase [Bordetella avium]
MPRYFANKSACLLLGLTLAFANPSWAADINPEASSGLQTKQLVKAKRYMIATANPLASQAGEAILARGGSAVDAVIAAQWVLNLTEPQSSGIGGGAFMLHYDQASHELVTYDSRETAPAAARADRFLRDGKPIPFSEAVNNGRAVATPGLLRGLFMAHADHGRLPWADLFTPAIELAEEGFAVSPRLHTLIASEREQLAAQPAAARYFLDPKGQPWPVGHRLRNPEFAQLLRRIAAEGPDAFYQGQVAHDIVAAVRGHAQPGDLSEADLANYRALRREPICGRYRGYRLCGAPPPSSGPLAVLQILGQLQPFTLHGAESLETVHLFAESGKLAFADRDFYVADPQFVNVPVTALLRPDYLRERSALIQPEHAMKRALPGDPAKLLAQRAADDAFEVPSTSHLVAVDNEGNVVSMTTTIESAFGSKIFVHGFLLNNEMTDFSSSWRDADGRLVANRIEPGKRPRSSMSPMIVFNSGKPWLALGSPGGSAIINYVAKTLVGVIDGGLDIQTAIDLPNMGSRNKGTELEKGTALQTLAPGLRAMGHDIKFVDFPSGVQGIAITPEGLEGGADPRREGVVLGR